jgi:hypothetical protein
MSEEYSIPWARNGRRRARVRQARCAADGDGAAPVLWSALNDKTANTEMRASSNWRHGGEKSALRLPSRLKPRASVAPQASDRHRGTVRLLERVKCALMCERERPGAMAWAWREGGLAGGRASVARPPIRSAGPVFIATCEDAVPLNSDQRHSRMRSRCTCCYGGSMAGRRGDSPQQ